MPYSRATEVALAAFSGGRCYWPTCDVPTVCTVEGEVVPNLQRAHIRARNLTGPRFDASMTDERRDDWSNLILLCHPHHTYVDKRHPEKYPPHKLHEWKRKREADTMRGLIGLGRVTEDDLQRIVGEAVEIKNERLEAAVSRLEQLGEIELAGVVRDLGRSADLTGAVGDMMPTSGMVSQLLTAADMLSAHLNNDMINKLLTAADMLSSVQVNPY